MSEHTPGPWNTGGVFDPNGISPTTNVWGRRDEGAQSGPLVAQAMTLADARLIAAAPDLLAALKAIDHTVCVHGQMDVGTELHDRIAALIAKAEGAT